MQGTHVKSSRQFQVKCAGEDRAKYDKGWVHNKIKSYRCVYVVGEGSVQYVI